MKGLPVQKQNEPLSLAGHDGVESSSVTFPVAFHQGQNKVVGGRIELVDGIRQLGKFFLGGSRCPALLGSTPPWSKHLESAISWISSPGAFFSLSFITGAHPSHCGSLQYVLCCVGLRATTIPLAIVVVWSAWGVFLP